jgi:limonene-1,2-epoxide hydrolase
MSEQTQTAQDTATVKPEEVVLAFYEAWDTIGFEKAYRKYLHPEVRVENPALPNWDGIETVMRGLDFYLRAFKRPYAKVDLHHMAVNGNVVLTERTEHNRNDAGDDTFSGNLMSVFEIEDAMIKRWAEYYDPADYKYGAAVPMPPLEWSA